MQSKDPAIAEVNLLLKGIRTARRCQNSPQRHFWATQCGGPALRMRRFRQQRTTPDLRRTTIMIKAVRGTRDLLPPETALWNFVESTVRDVFRAYNFHEIRTPIFEST